MRKRRHASKPGTIEDLVERMCDDPGTDDERRALAARVRATAKFADPERGSRALLWALEVARELGEVDLDTPTLLLVRAVELTPSDDELLLEYLREVAASGYFCTELTLLDVALRRGNHDRHTRRLALAASFAEMYALGPYLSRSPPPRWATDMARWVFARAREAHGDEQGWLALRDWLREQIHDYDDVPIDAWARHAR